MQQTPNLNRFFATPAIYLPDMNNEEWQEELNKMVVRSLITQKFTSGKITPDDFMDALDFLGVDVISCVDDWNDGLSYL